MRKRTLLTSILGSAGVVIGLGAGLAAASIPDSGGVIHGCYKAQGYGHKHPTREEAEECARITMAGRR
jgi:hypothetical protein